jgi:hypothetical protein
MAARSPRFSESRTAYHEYPTSPRIQVRGLVAFWSLPGRFGNRPVRIAIEKIFSIAPSKSGLSHEKSPTSPSLTIVMKGPQ